MNAPQLVVTAIILAFAALLVVAFVRIKRGGVHGASGMFGVFEKALLAGAVQRPNGDRIAGRVTGGTTSARRSAASTHGLRLINAADNRYPSPR